MNRRLLLVAASLLCALAFGGSMAAAQQPVTPLITKPVAVLELFTSQGCSSCPPADKLLWEFSDLPDMIVISEHVDYWDYLGWKDTLALPETTARQRAYAKVRGDGRVYTPQMVVNGLGHAVGSDKAEIERLLKSTRQETAVLATSLTFARDGERIALSLPAPDKPVTAEILLIPIVPVMAVEIQRGENRGRIANYRNAARAIIRLGRWTADNRSFSIDRASLPPQAIKVVAIVQSFQDDKPGALLGAALAKIVP